jgi:hypothetical protein
MAGFKLKKFAYDFAEMHRQMREHIARDVVWEMATSRTPGAVWFDNTTTLSSEIKAMLADSIGCPLYETFWLCDYRTCKTLEIHKDYPGAEYYPFHSMFTFIMMLEGRFEVSIWEDDQVTLVDKVIIPPGEILVLNSSQYYHSGLALDSVKLSLHGYPRIPAIDSPNVPKERYDVDLFV